MPTLMLAGLGPGHHGPEPPPVGSRYSLHLLLLISILAIVPRVYVATTHPLDYDEYWNLFVAQQDTRAGLAAEWRANEHPPLYYWLLKLPLSLGRGRLLDRSLSLLAGVIAVFVLGRIVAQFTSRLTSALLAALAFAFSPTAVVISSQNRSYMLCTLFILLAFSEFLLFLRGHPPLRAAVLFALFSCLALMSHYFTVFFLLACLAALLYVVAIHLVCKRDTLSLVVGWWPSVLVATCPILATAAWLYRTHLKGLRTSHLTHLSAFYYRPESGQSVLRYVAGAAQKTFNVFSPASIGQAASVPVFLLSVTVLVVSLVHFARIRRRSEDIPRCLPWFFFLFMSGSMLTASIEGVYPFGGELRHQFILFPFLLITAFQVMDWMMSMWHRVTFPLAGLALVGICLNGTTPFRQPRASTDKMGNMFAEEMALYCGVFPEPETVYVDQFTLILFFAHHDRWQWKRLDERSYEVIGPGRRIDVLRKFKWSLDFLDERLYDELAEWLRSTERESTAVCSLRYPSGTRPPNSVEQDAFRQKLTTLAARHGLKTTRLVLDGFDVFAQLSR